MPALTIEDNTPAVDGTFFSRWAEAQTTRGAEFKNAPAFYRNLEEELDLVRSQCASVSLHTQHDLIDFSSCDCLSLGSSGAIREAFLEELAANPGFQLGSHGSRLMDGNTQYQEDLEREIAEFHNVESALIVNTGGIANESIFSTIPRPGDVLLYDELIHTSTLTGMKSSLALWQKSFRHNDVESFVERLEEIRETQPLVRNGKRSVLVAIEGFYSMDGDVCPIEELIETAKEVFPNGAVQFVMDEAHSFGPIGPNGGGLVDDLGIEKDIAIRMHTFGKALSGSGAVILSNNTIRSMLLNNAKVLMCSIAPAFPLLAATRAGFKILKSERGEQAREKLLHNTRFFLDTITSHPTFKKANKMGVLRIPIHEDEDWNDVPYVSQVCPVWVQNGVAINLSIHLLSKGISAYPIFFPIVPKGEDRVRFVMHTRNTEDEIKYLVETICEFAEEMMVIQKSANKKKLPSAAANAMELLKKNPQNNLNAVKVNGLKVVKGMGGLKINNTLASQDAAVKVVA